jgi:hypothetical protein
MDEKRIRRGPGMTDLIQRMAKLICTLTKINPAILHAGDN